MVDVCKAGGEIRLQKRNAMKEVKAIQKGLKIVVAILFGIGMILITMSFFLSDEGIKEGLFSLAIAFCMASMICFVCKRWFVLKPTREDLEGMRL